MLNENIRSLRKTRGLSQEALAAKLHIVRQTLSKWAQGLSVPDAEMLTRLAEALETTVPALLGETPPEPESTETIESLAEKLAALNEQYSREMTRRRRVWRIICSIVLVLALLTLAVHMIAAVYAWQTNREISAAVGVIGGADGPTRVFVSRASAPWISLTLTIAAGAAALFGLYRLRKGGRA